MCEKEWTVELHHGGQFVDSPRKAYVGGKVDMFDHIVADTMSLPEFWDMGKTLNYPDHTLCKYFYKDPRLSLNEGLVKLENDKDVLKMLECHLTYSIITAYLVAPPVEEHNVGEAETIEEEYIVDEAETDEEEYIVDEAETDEEEEALVNKINFGDAEEDQRVDSDIEELISVDVGVITTRAGLPIVDDVNNVANEPHEGSGVDKTFIEEELSVDTSEEQSEDELEYNDAGADDSDELRSVDGSDEEIPKYPVYREPTKPQDKSILKLGMKFLDAKQFRKALRRHAVLSGYDLHFKKNEGDRITCVCKDSRDTKKEGNNGCQWRIHASWNDIEAAFMIKTYNPNHTCSRVFENTQATSELIYDMYMENLRDDPDWKLSAMQKAVHRDLGIDVSISKIYKAKRRAKYVIEGGFVEQYSKLWDYCNIIHIRNPGSFLRMKVHRPCLDEKATFQRLFISYGAWIEGFKTGCRKLIGLDGCFLKGSFGGQMLSAVGRDANNGIYPIAIAVVEAEITDSWTWFLMKLLEAIGSIEDYGWCFISDRQKGLEESFERVMPQAHHRFCMRHLYANYKSNGFKSLKLKDEMWFAATSFTKEEFQEHLMNIKTEDEKAYNYLIKIDPSQWARSHFDPKLNCELLCNNLSESWNHFIIKARDKPILTMLEMIRRLVMRRIQVNSIKMARHEGLLCPKPQAKLDMCKDNSRSCQAIYAGCRQFEVLSFNTFHAVDLDKKTCSCKRWDFTGIPCNHAVSAIWKMKLKPEDFVDVCFHKQTYLKTYTPIMHPLIDMSLWPKTGHEAVMPPILRSKTGRPKKKRKRAKDEAKQPYKLKRLSNTLRCKRCHQYGHNSRTCKGAPVGECSHNTTRNVRGKGGRPPKNITEKDDVLGDRGTVKVGKKTGAATRGRGGSLRGRRANATTRGRSRATAATQKWFESSQSSRIDLSQSAPPSTQD